MVNYIWIYSLRYKFWNKSKFKKFKDYDGFTNDVIKKSLLLLIPLFMIISLATATQTKDLETLILIGKLITGIYLNFSVFLWFYFITFKRGIYIKLGYKFDENKNS